ncbi:helix-turn-helix transcriptional regulator [Senegalia massiliensis]|uniref:XRE family transcriptional regulator n=1 Tax=Senegalia massiliensis TaxID=1720316 RepID=A0A845R0S8_9CLOT|nr:helix-turn-helix transcriptional regulator [Senegalia massiliensis]NBI07609.1 XRE family transcriptional regulator [Senegalia massiliensis]
MENNNIFVVQNTEKLKEYTQKGNLLEEMIKYKTNINGEVKTFVAEGYRSIKAKIKLLPLNEVSDNNADSDLNIPTLEDYIKNKTDEVIKENNINAIDKDEDIIDETEFEFEIKVFNKEETLMVEGYLGDSKDIFIHYEDILNSIRAIVNNIVYDEKEVIKTTKRKKAKIVYNEVTVCDNCNSTDIMKDLIDYKVKVFGEKQEYDVEGYRCKNCNSKWITKEMKDNLMDRIIRTREKLRKVKEQESYKKRLENKILKLKEKNLKPIIINNVKSLREEKTTQKRIGEFLGYSEQRYGSIERNDNTPTITTVKAIADALEVSTDDLYQLEYVSKEFYDVIRNLTYDEKNHRYITIKPLEQLNTMYDETENYRQQKMQELRTIKSTNEIWLEKKDLESHNRKLKREIDNIRTSKQKDKEELIKLKKKQIETNTKAIDKLENTKEHQDIEKREQQIKDLSSKVNNIINIKRDVEKGKMGVLKKKKKDSVEKIKIKNSLEYDRNDIKNGKMKALLKYDEAITSEHFRRLKKIYDKEYNKKG